MEMSNGREYLPYADCDLYLLDASLLAPATKSVPSVTVADYDGPVTSTDCPIENAGYVGQTAPKEPNYYAVGDGGDGGESHS
jgi:hypothetical protein